MTTSRRPTTRVVSVRVPIGLPEKVKAATGQPFSKAIVQFFVPFVEHMERMDTAEDPSNG